jgi:hypothetical protein
VVSVSEAAATEIQRVRVRRGKRNTNDFSGRRAKGEAREKKHLRRINRTNSP